MNINNSSSSSNNDNHNSWDVPSNCNKTILQIVPDKVIIFNNINNINT